MKKNIFLFLFSLILFMDMGFSQSNMKQHKIKRKLVYIEKLGKKVEIAEDVVMIKFKPKRNILKKMAMVVGIKVKPEKIKLAKRMLPAGMTIKDFIQQVQQQKDVEIVEPNYILKKTGNINDEFYNNQWGLKKIEWDRCEAVIENATEVKVAVIDSGVFPHLDLQNNLLKGYNFIADTTNNMDDNGHGTMISGVLAAVQNNIGIVGVNPKAKILPLKILDEDGYGTYSGLVDAINYAVDNGVKIINLSLGGEVYSDILKSTIDYATSRGCIVIAAAGDFNNNQPLYPANYDNVISVIDVDENDKINSQANFYNSIDYAAPGIGIYSCTLNNKYKYATGSSMATPFLSGLISLMVGLDKSLTLKKIKIILDSSSDYIPPYKLKDGLDIKRINIYRAIGIVNNIKEPDISIIDMRVIPENPAKGQTATVEVCIQNQGNETTSETSLKILIDEQIITNIQVPALLLNEVIKKEIVWNVK